MAATEWLNQNHVQPFWNEFNLGLALGDKDPVWFTTQLALFGDSDQDAHAYPKDLGVDDDNNDCA